jgi:hypothetical protein
LARVDLANQKIDSSVRPLVYSNRLVYELILCLSDRVASVAQARVLLYVSGDGQSGQAGNALNNKLRVQLVDGANTPVSGETIQFEVSSGGGSVQPVTISTDAQGFAEASWTLGKQNSQKLVALAVGSVFTVTFTATAT